MKSVCIERETVLEAVFAEVAAERRRQIVLYGDQSDRPLRDWPCILGEEFVELCEAISETTLDKARHPERGGRENILREACHVAAVAVQLMEIVIGEMQTPKEGSG